MRYITQCVELLERGARELDEKLPINNRLSLIVTDNIIELMLHFRCKNIFQEQYFHTISGNGRFTRAYQARILGPGFDDKLNFLRKEGEIETHEANLISICHRYRNEAYHIGLNHEDIIYPLAWEYHSLACELFGRLRRNGRGVSSNEIITPVLGKYIGTDHKHPMRILLELNQASLAKAISDSKKSLPTPLSETLSEERLRRITSLEDDLKFLLENNPREFDSDQTLKDIQWSADLFGNIPINIEEHSKEYTKHIKNKLSEMKQTWIPKFKRFPFSSWRKRAVAIKNKNVFTALQTYENLKLDMDYLDKALTECAAMLDEHIQNQIDEAMGK